MIDKEYEELKTERDFYLFVVEDLTHELEAQTDYLAEMWEIFNSVQKGIEQAKNGEFVDGPDEEEYEDDDDEWDEWEDWEYNEPTMGD